MANKKLFVAVLCIAVSCHFTLVSTQVTKIKSSSTTLPNGDTKGRCSYTDTDGYEVFILYTRTASGDLIEGSESNYRGHFEEALNKCQELADEYARQLEEKLSQNFANHEEAFKKHQDEFEANMNKHFDQVGTDSPFHNANAGGSKGGNVKVGDDEDCPDDNVSVGDDDDCNGSIGRCGEGIGKVLVVFGVLLSSWMTRFLIF